MSVQTPWGESQSDKEHAEGITFYTTASHGGFHLSDEREAELRKLLPDWCSFNGNHTWYEEDCDWAVVVIVFPQYFGADILFNAARVARTWQDKSIEACKWAAVVKLLDRPEIKKTLDRETKRRERLWERGSMFAGGFRSDLKGKWVVYLTRGDESKKVLMDYPKKSLYTDKEVAKFEEYVPEKHDRPKQDLACHGSQGL